MKNKSVDLTQGSITRAMLLFVLPLLGTSIIQQMYNWAFSSPYALPCHSQRVRMLSCVCFPVMRRSLI